MIAPAPQLFRAGGRRSVIREAAAGPVKPPDAVADVARQAVLGSSRPSDSGTRRFRIREAKTTTHTISARSAQVSTELLHADAAKAALTFSRERLAAYVHPRLGMLGVIQNLSLAFRALRRRPGYAGLVIATLALGIASSAAVFSVFSSVLLAPLPFDRPDRLAVILWGDSLSPAAPVEYLEWRRQSRSFDKMAAAEAWGPSLTGEGDPEKLSAVHVSPQMFEMLGRPPRLGRGFSGNESEGSGGDEVVLSYGLWQRRFGGDPSVIGKQIMLDERPYEVVGVADKSFRFPTFWIPRAELWGALRFTPERAADRFGSSLRIFGRLADGPSLDQAQAEMTSIARGIVADNPDMKRSEHLEVKGLHEASVGAARPTLALVALAGAALLLIACVNVANLMLVRASQRSGEMAVRQALGAGRTALAAPLAAEGFLLWLAAACLGLLLANAGVSALLALLPPGAQQALPRHDEIEIGFGALSAALGVSGLAVAVFSMLPGLRVGAYEVANKLRQTGRGGLSAAPSRALVVAQIALATGLLVAGTLLVESMRKQMEIDPGFQGDRTLTALIPTARSEYSNPARRVAFYQALLDNLNARPRVEAASLVNHIPLAGDLWGLSFVVEGQPEPAPSEFPTGVYRVSAPGYFRALGANLRQGRDFNDRDDQDAPPVVVINQTLASKYFPGRSAVGKRIRIGRDASDPLREIVGVVADIAEHDWTAPAASEVYIPFLQDRMFRDSNRFPMTLVVRTSTTPSAMAAVVREEVHRLDPDLPVAALQTMPEIVADTLWRPRMTAAAVSSFALAALALAAIGVFGVLSFAVALRTSELGLRAALGAAPAELRRLVLRDAWRIAAAGCAIGVAGAAALASTWSALLYEVAPLDPLAAAAAVAALGATVTLAAWLPARRAAAVDPLEALRGD